MTRSQGSASTATPNRKTTRSYFPCPGKAGFLDGATVRFNPNLNVLVGGRGAGKSTIIESLRYVLDLEPIGEEARKAHLKERCGRCCVAGRKSPYELRSHRPVTSEYLIERIVNNPPVVRGGDGQISNLAAQRTFCRGLKSMDSMKSRNSPEAPKI